MTKAYNSTICISTTIARKKNKNPGNPVNPTHNDSEPATANMASQPTAASMRCVADDFPEFVPSSKDKNNLSLSSSVQSMTEDIAIKVLAGGKELRNTVKIRGGFRFVDNSQNVSFVAKKAPTTQTATVLSLKRLVAAAGIYLATNGTTKVAVNSLAEGHGLSELLVSDPAMYWLYNIGLEYEVEFDNHLPRVLALMGWRFKHAEVLHKTNKREHAEDFRAAAPILEVKLGTDDKWIAAANEAKFYIDILKNIQPNIKPWA